MAASESVVWTPYPAPSHPEKPLPTSQEPIRIRHPGYEDALNTLLKFWPLDRGGVHYETVRIACAILVDNTLDCYLSEDSIGEFPVDSGPETILRAKSYYLHIARPAEVVDYPITPNFEHWRFPHNRLPPYWQDIISFNQASRPSDDTSCRITQYEDSVENAHLIPVAQKEWFNKNAMYDYVPETATHRLKHISNTIRLRSDIHTIFDAKRFAIVPIEKRLVVYCFNEAPGSQVERLYHGVELHRLRVSGYFIHFLLARFAYTVFQHLRGFLDANTSRNIRLRVENNWITELCGHDKCQAFARVTASQGKSGSVSPKKRQRTQDTEELESVEDESSDEEELRGRKRRRTDESSSVATSQSFASTYTSESVTTPERFLLPMHQKASNVVSRGGSCEQEGYCHSPGRVKYTER